MSSSSTYARHRRRLLFALLVATALALGVSPAGAQYPVIDVANLVQNVLTAARTLEEISNQITQIQQFVQMLQNQARNLTSLPFSIAQQLDQSVSQITSLMGQAQGVLYDIQNVQSQFQRFYPTTIGAAASDAQLIADAQTRWQYSLSALQHTMEVQSQIVQDLPVDQGQLDALVGQSQGASESCRRPRQAISSWRFKPSRLARFRRSLLLKRAPRRSNRRAKPKPSNRHMSSTSAS